MKPFFLFLLLIGSGILFAILARPFAYLAALFRLPQRGFSRLAVCQPRFRAGYFPGGLRLPAASPPPASRAF